MNDQPDQTDLSKIRESLIADLRTKRGSDLSESLQEVSAIDLLLKEQQDSRLQPGWQLSLVILAFVSLLVLLASIYRPPPGSISLAATTNAVNLHFEDAIQLNLGQPGGTLLEISGDFETLDSLDNLIDFEDIGPQDAILGSIVTSLALGASSSITVEAVKENVVRYRVPLEGARIGLNVPAERFCQLLPAKCVSGAPLNFVFLRQKSGTLSVTVRFEEDRALSTLLVAPVTGELGFKSFSFSEPRAIAGLSSSVSRLSEASITYRDYGEIEHEYSFGDELLVRIVNGFAATQTRDGLISLKYSGSAEGISDGVGTSLSPSLLDYVLAEPKFLAISTLALSVFGLLSASIKRARKVYRIVTRKPDELKNS